MHEVSASLESATPRWAIIFGLDFIDEPLARSRILQNKGRAILRPAITFAKAIVYQIFEAVEVWNFPITDASRSATSFATTTLEASEALLIITAGLNTVLFTRDALTSKTMATEVLNIAAHKDNFLMLDSLERRLRNLADGAEQLPPTSFVALAASTASATTKLEAANSRNKDGPISVKRELLDAHASLAERVSSGEAVAKRARLGALLRK